MITELPLLQLIKTVIPVIHSRYTQFSSAAASIHFEGTIMSRHRSYLASVVCLVTTTSYALAAPATEPNRQLVLCEASPTSISSVAVSPDGKIVATASGEGHIRLHDAQTGSLLRITAATGDRSVAFSPDGRRLTASGFQMDKIVKLADVATGNIIARFEGHSAIEMYSTAISPDGTLLASACRDHEILVWDIATRKLLYRIDDAPSITLAFSPDGKILSGGANDKQIRFWDARSGQLQRTLTGHTDSVVTLAFSRDGSILASGSCDWTNHRGRDMSNFAWSVPPCVSQLRFWDVESGTIKQSFDEPGRLLSLAIHPDGKSLAYTIDNQVRRCDVPSSQPGSVIARFDFGATCVAFTPDGRSIVAGSHDQTVQRVNLSTGQVEWKAMGSYEQINSVAVSNDGSFLVTGSSDRRFSIRTVKAGGPGLKAGAARLWDARTARLLRRLDGLTDQVMGVSISPNGKRIVIAGANKSGAGVIQVCDPDGSSIWSTADHEKEVVGIAHSPDGTQLASAGAEGTVIIRDAETSAVLQTLTGHDGGATSVEFSPNGEAIAAGDGRGGLKIWDAKRGRLLHTCPTSDPKAAQVNTDRLITSITFIPNSTKFFACAATMGNTYGDAVHLWDTQTGEASAAPKMGGRPIVLSPDGKTFAAGGKTIQLYEIPSGNKLHRLTGHMKKIQAIAFSQKGGFVYGGGSYGTLNIWDTAKGQLLVTLFMIPNIHGRAVSDHWLAYRPDGYFDGSPGIEQLVAWQIGDHLKPASEEPRMQSSEKILSALKIEQ